MAHIVMSMRRLVPFAWLVAIVIAGCAPATLAGTDLGATNAPDFTLTDGLSDPYPYNGYRRCGWVRQFDVYGNYIGRVNTCY